VISKEEFWSLLLKGPLRELVENLSVGECTQPLSLHELAAQAGIRAVLTAPKLISLDTLESLPPSLKQRGLYVIRLGQRHKGRATFILCKASANYAREALRPEDLEKARGLQVELSHLPRWILSLARRLSSEAIALIAAISFIKALSGTPEVQVIPSMRLASAKFEFKPTEASGPYTYWGQVEIDAALGADRIYVLEAKSGRRSLLKYKLAFSALALAGFLEEPVHPLLAFISRRGTGVEVELALLNPPAGSEQQDLAPYVIDQMEPVFRAKVSLSS